MESGGEIGPRVKGELHSPPSSLPAHFETPPNLSKPRAFLISEDYPSREAAAIPLHVFRLFFASFLPPPPSICQLDFSASLPFFKFLFVESPFLESK